MDSGSVLLIILFSLWWRWDCSAAVCLGWRKRGCREGWCFGKSVGCGRYCRCRLLGNGGLEVLADQSAGNRGGNTASVPGIFHQYGEGDFWILGGSIGYEPGVVFAVGFWAVPVLPHTATPGTCASVPVPFRTTSAMLARRRSRVSG